MVPGTWTPTGSRAAESSRRGWRRWEAPGTRPRSASRGARNRADSGELSHVLSPSRVLYIRQISACAVGKTGCSNGFAKMLICTTFQWNRYINGGRTARAFHHCANGDPNDAVQTGSCLNGVGPPHAAHNSELVVHQ